MQADLSGPSLDLYREVLTKLAATTLAWLLSHTAAKAYKKATSAEPSAQAAAKRAIETLRFPDPRQGEFFYRFLSSPEIQAVARQILASKLLAPDDTTRLPSIREEFTTLLALHVDVAKPRLTPFADQLFDTLLEGCEAVLDDAIQKGVLSAHETKSNLRVRILLDELENLRRNVLALAGEKRPDVHSILQFEARYRDQVRARHSFIIPPHYSGPQISDQAIS